MKVILLRKLLPKWTWFVKTGMKSKKVILDTNLWISFLISKKFNAIDSLLEKGDIILIFSEESLE